MMNELEMKYYLKDLEQRMKRWEASAADQATCGVCLWVQSIWQATRRWLGQSAADPNIATNAGHDAA